MPISMTCPHCGLSGRLPDSFKADSARCPGCGKTFRVDPGSAAVRVAGDTPGVRRAARSEEAAEKQGHSFLTTGVSLWVTAVVGAVALLIGTVGGGAAGYWAGFRAQATTQASPPGPAGPAANWPSLFAGAEKPAVVVNANELEKDFAANLAAGDLKYQGKLVEVANVWSEVKKDHKGRYYVAGGQPRVKNSGMSYGTTSIAGARAAMQSAVLADTFPGLVFFIDKKDAESFLALKKPKRVTVRGMCRGGEKRDDLLPDFTVSFENCTLVEDAK